MKKYIMAAIAAVATMSLFTSCSEEESVKMNTKDGAPIRFSAITKAANGTRTSYSTEMKNGKWNLYWVSDDQVTIFCPDANTQGTNENVATYTVVETSASDKVTKYALSGEGLHWGAEDEHHFYEAYPSKNVSEITATSVTATIPSTQKAKLQEDGYYADMDAALMAGKTSCKKSEVETTGLDIPFEPIFTAVDITVTASENIDFTLNSITVANSEKAISTQQPLAGKFTYTFDAPVESKFASVSTEDDSYNVQLEFPTPITLSSNPDVEGAVPEVKATVFLRGDFINAVKVVLNGSGKTSIGNSLVQVKKQGAAGDKLIALARNHVILGNLPKEEFQPMTGEWWVSHTHNDTYVSQMSLPGVYDAANFIDHETGDDRAQTHLYKVDGKNPCENLGRNDPETHFYEQMSAYLNAGNRVFDFKPTYSDGNWINKRIMNAGYRQRTIEFKKMVEAADDWLKAHTTEFVIFIMSDYDWEDENSGYGANLSAMLRSIIPASRLMATFNPDITVEEARGKILIINASPCINPIGISATDWQLNKAVKGTYTKILGADVLTGVTGGRSEYNEVKSHTYTMGSGNGKIVVHDYNNLHNTNDKTVENKQTWVKGNITDASKNTDADTWFVTSSAYRYNAIAFDLTYGDAAGTMRPLVKQWVSELSTSTTYKKCGIILQAYAAADGTSSTSLENTIWANNYKGDGPLKNQNK